MCGRFTLALPTDDLQLALPWLDVPADMPPRYNIAPSQPVAVVPNNNLRQIEFFRWGLIPSWAKDHKIGYRMINARAETLAQKPSFRAAYRRRRCLVLADGFYEWQGAKGTAKTPHHIRLESGAPFALAGLWETWHSPDGSVIPSCTIITTQPNTLVAPIHNRMPVILPPEAYEEWLASGERTPAELQPLLVPFPAELMVAHPISRLVNNPKNDQPECILPL